MSSSLTEPVEPAPVPVNSDIELTVLKFNKYNDGVDGEHLGVSRGEIIPFWPFFGDFW